MPKNRNHNKCKNEDTDCCVLFSACNDCYYYEECKKKTKKSKKGVNNA
jgi:hypothetical protein